MGWMDPGIWGGPQPGQGGGGGCPLPDQTMPWRAGTLAVGTGCPPCPPVPQPDSNPDGGTVPAPGDTGARDGCTSSSTGILPFPTDVSGGSPLVLDYTVDLSLLPPNVRIIRAVAAYTLQVEPGVTETHTITDDGGSTTGSSNDWFPAGLATLNGDPGNTAHAASARCVFTTTPPGREAGFAVTSFTVTYCAAVGT